MQLFIGKVTLARGLPEESVQGLTGVPVSQVQESTAVGADSAVFTLRGNKKTTFTFSVERVHASAEEAADFCVRHEAQFPVQDIFIYRTDSGELYLPGAVAVVTKYSCRNATTTHAYSVVGGCFLTKLPSTSD